jgi:hypothetical protein
VNDSQHFEDEVLERVREFAPVVPADVLSSTGPSAQRVLDHALATAARAGAADSERQPMSPSTTRAAGSSWLTRRRIGALAGVVTAVAVVVAILVIGSGGEASIVGRAYAATDPAGAIVHYVETSRSSSPGIGGAPQVTEYWIDGPDSHQILNDNHPKFRQDIVTSDGKSETLAFGRLVVGPAWPASTRCAAAIVLEGGCAQGQNSMPIDGLRSLLRSGQLHAAGHTTINGRRVDVLTGDTGNLRVRALIDARTFAPVKIAMTLTFPQGRGKRPVIDMLTITDYQRLPVTARNRTLLALPAHPNVPVIHLRACPTKANPDKQCRSDTQRHLSGARARRPTP